MPADLKVRAQVVEGAGVAAQEPLVLAGDAGEHRAQRAVCSVAAHSGPVDVVVRLVGEDGQRTAEHRGRARCQGHREADLAFAVGALQAVDAIVTARPTELRTGQGS